jgi:thiosulfate dehydrogenase
MDAGAVTLFVASLAINNGTWFLNDRFYATWATLAAALPGDVDGDLDADLRDAAAMQRCFGEAVLDAEDPCQYADATADDFVSLEDAAVLVDSLTGPTATAPAAYVQADAVRGGMLYDRWWPVSRSPEPTGDHPLYPLIGQQSDSATFRCKECHGWDYRGADGAYGEGSHYTGIRGVADTTLSAQEIFDLLKADPMEIADGHDLDAYGLTDRDLWDVVKMTLEGVVDTDPYIDAAGGFVGNEALGSLVYASVCMSCHGSDGTTIDFGEPGSPEYVGTIANDNPWEFLHKVRFGHPGSPMPTMDLLQYSVQLSADVGVYSQTLPVE